MFKVRIRELNCPKIHSISTCLHSLLESFYQYTLITGLVLTLCCPCDENVEHLLGRYEVCLKSNETGAIKFFVNN
jgi:hypothetical protein